MRYVPVDVRLGAKTRKTATCWLWTGSRRPTGYGFIRIARETRATHRVAWELANGAIPDGLHVLHRCDTPSCVNPAHLFLGTHGDNMRDMVAKGRHGRPESSKTHCPKGHAYDAVNTRIAKNGGRLCKPCQRACMRRLYHERAGRTC